jgi:hypothetical protein
MCAEDNPVVHQLRAIPSVALLGAVSVVDSFGRQTQPHPSHLRLVRARCAEEFTGDPADDGVQIWNSWLAAHIEGDTDSVEMVLSEPCTFAYHGVGRCDRCHGTGVLTATLFLRCIPNDLGLNSFAVAASAG